MKTKLLFRFLFAAGCLASLLFAQPSPAAEMRKDEAAIEGIVAGFREAMNAKNATAFAHVFHEDADFTNWKGMTAQGRKAIEEFHRVLFEGDGTKGMASFRNARLQIADTRIRFLRPDVASVDVRWLQTGAVLDGKDLGTRQGIANWIATNERGKWAIAVMHNTALPAPAPAP
jgi:uncharacterized protein (TIGR02246 family)